MVDLDNPEVYERFDLANMRAHLHRFPEQCLQAWQKAKTFPLPSDYAHADKIIILGIGGSAIGGDLVQGLTSSLAKPVIFVHRDYNLPPFVDERTLVIASSYSGMTEETLSAFSQALKTKTRKLVITAGGKLKELADKHELPIFPIDYTSPPRVALGYSFIPLLYFLFKLGFVKEEPPIKLMVKDLETLLKKLKETTPASSNPAKQLTAELYNKLLIIYGAGFLGAVARRWKTQLNENSKAWAFSEVFPELNHNAIVGYKFPQPLAEQVYVILLRSPSFPPPILLRYKVTAEILTRANIKHKIIDSQGKNELTQVMQLTFLGDWVSYYLSILYQTDPTPVEAIDYLKGRLLSLRQEKINRRNTLLT